jgi:ATP-dependent DNA helicase PIF1
MSINNLSPEQKHALYKFKRGENLFITGPGGTGKTYLIRHLINSAKESKKNVQVCALTGCASVLLNCSARTIHSWSGIKLARGDANTIIESVLRSNRTIKNWQSVKILIVDEVSMMSKKIFNILNEIGKRVRHSSLPFGGIQLVFTGDFFQLPPVGNNMNDPGSEDFCFESDEWYKVFAMENHIELNSMFRQKDQDYIDILNEIRRGELSEKNAEKLKKYVGREYLKPDNILYTPTKLFPTRAKTDYINNMMFNTLDEDEYHLELGVKTDCTVLLDGGNNKNGGKTFSYEQILKCQRMTPPEREYEIENLKNNTPCEKILKLKKGSNVLCCANLDLDSGICNGSQGIVTRIEELGEATIIEVKFTNGITRVIEPHWWQSEEYPCIAIKQYPLLLSWAMTIHKIQGATLDMAEIDIGSSIFEYGQTYVALSRIKSLNGLYLSDFNPNKIKPNPKVINFYKGIPKIDLCEVENKANTTSNSNSNSNIFSKFAYKESDADTAELEEEEIEEYSE